jgi:hypothetical protein
VNTNTRLLYRFHSTENEIRERDGAPTNALLSLEAEIFHLRQIGNSFLDLSNFFHVAIGEDVRASRQARAVWFTEIEIQIPLCTALSVVAAEKTPL